MEITRLMRAKQFIFTDSLISKNKDKEIKCGQTGHNKTTTTTTKRSCIMHPSHPAIVFEESDEEQ